MSANEFTLPNVTNGMPGMIELLKRWSRLEPEWCKIQGSELGCFIYISDANPLDGVGYSGWNVVANYEPGMNGSGCYWSRNGEAVRCVQFAVQCAIEGRGWEMGLRRIREGWVARVTHHNHHTQSEYFNNPAEALLSAYLLMLMEKMSNVS